MRRLKILKNILVRTKAYQLILSFLAFIMIDSLIILLVEPDITHYGDAIWYCFVSLTTIGFGDIVAKTLIGRVATVLLSVYALFILAIITGVVVNFYTQIIEIQQKETVAAFIDQLEHLPDMSREELEDLSARAKKFHTNILDK